MIPQGEELVTIIAKFAECGWDVIDAPSKAWLEAIGKGDIPEAVTAELVTAVEQADKECGSCGCEFDPLYKRALELLRA
jgi:hypothetical protein